MGALDSNLGEEICDIGRRMYARQFCSANEGNISCRLDDNRVLCTPTLHCKGFMKPSDLCVVDMEGQQIEGTRRRTSEILLHLEIYRHRADVTSVVHCHPPHATAFAIAREDIPMGVLPEAEIFLGKVPMAPYQLPGTRRFAETIAPFVGVTNVILLANHGTVSFGPSPERAFWLTEILDGYCRVLMNARGLGRICQFNAAELAELAELRRQWGMDLPLPSRA